MVRYEIDVRRLLRLKESGSSVVVGDGRIYVDNELIATVEQARVGVFKDIIYRDYPRKSKNSIGGILQR